MNLKTRFEINTRTAEVAQRGNVFANTLALSMAHQCRRIARQNVAPGRGPGPHPHKPESQHEDTGALMESIEVVPEERGFLKTANVMTDLDYGVYLEMGWHNPDTGNFWRYPWLWPAADETRQDSEAIARSTARETFSDLDGQTILAARAGSR